MVEKTIDFRERLEYNPDRWNGDTHMTKRIEARTKTQKLALSLAVAYNAFTEADRAVPSIWSETDETKLNDIRVWGRSLLDAQKAVGFEMYRTALIEDTVARAQERSERLRREKAAA